MSGNNLNESHILGLMTDDLITGRKLGGLILPDGTMVPLTHWYRLTATIATYALEHGQLPSPPICRSPSATSPLLAQVGAAKMREPCRLDPPFNDWQVEGNISAVGTQKACLWLLELAGLDHREFRVFMLAGSPKRGWSRSG